MALRKDVKGLGMPWEDQYGYVQAVKVDNTIYVSGQLSHDDQGNMVGAAPLDDSGKIRDHSNMEIQMHQTYANAKKILSEFGATLDNVVEEVLYVTDMDTAFAMAGAVRAEAYGGRPVVASTILVIDGHSGSGSSAALAVAKRVCRAGNWLNSTRMP